MITQEYLKECVHYDPDTGVFTWLNRPRNHFRTEKGCSMFNDRCSGKRADRVKKESGYMRINIDGKPYYAHRLAMLYITGSAPECIDHINGNRSDNWISNLRKATIHENQRNTKGRGGHSKFIGVQWQPERKSWRAEVSCCGRRMRRRSKSELDAAMIRDRIAARMHGRFASFNFPCMMIGNRFIIVE